MVRCRKSGVIRRHRPAPLKTCLIFARLNRRVCMTTGIDRMIFPTGVSRRSIAMAAAMVGMMSVAIGAHAALNKRSPAVAHAGEVIQKNSVAEKSSRLALVIGNGNYPDAPAPLTQPINDARAISAALQREGFEVDRVENASRRDVEQALDRLNDRIGPESVVMLFFGGYGIQAGRESFMI